MPELFVRCPVCEGKPLLPIPKSYYSDQWTEECHNPLCERGFVRYGQEPGHQHIWIAPICACGTTAAEVTA